MAKNVWALVNVVVVMRAGGNNMGTAYLICESCGESTESGIGKFHYKRGFDVITKESLAYEITGFNTWFHDKNIENKFCDFMVKHHHKNGCVIFIVDEGDEKYEIFEKRRNKYKNRITLDYDAVGNLQEAIRCYENSVKCLEGIKEIVFGGQDPDKLKFSWDDE